MWSKARFVLLVLCMIAGGNAVWVGCKKKASQPPSPPRKAPEGTPVAESAVSTSATSATPGQASGSSTIYAFKLAETTSVPGGGIDKVWELTAASATQQGQDGPFELEDVTLKFFKDNQVAGTLTGKKGSFDEKARKGGLSGGISGESSEGYLVSTDTLKWEKATEEISTEDPVKITFGESAIEGSGLKASLTMKRFKTTNVRGRVIVEE